MAGAVLVSDKGMGAIREPRRGMEVFVSATKPRSLDTRLLVR